MLIAMLIDLAISLIDLLLSPLQLLQPLDGFAQLISQSIYFFEIPIRGGVMFFDWLFGSSIWKTVILLSLVLFPVEQFIKFGYFIYSFLPFVGRKSS